MCNIIQKSWVLQKSLRLETKKSYDRNLKRYALSKKGQPRPQKNRTEIKNDQNYAIVFYNAESLEYFTASLNVRFHDMQYQPQSTFQNNSINAQQAPNRNEIGWFSVVGELSYCIFHRLIESKNCRRSKMHHSLIGFFQRRDLLTFRLGLSVTLAVIG